MLVMLFSRLTENLETSLNVKIIDTILIDFVERCIQRHYQEGNNYAGMPDAVKNQISELFVRKTVDIFKVHNLVNDTIAKQKMLELYSLIILVCKEPCRLLQLTLPLFDHIVQTEYSYIEQVLNIIQKFLYRTVKFDPQLVIPT